MVPDIGNWRSDFQIIFVLVSESEGEIPVVVRGGLITT